MWLQATFSTSLMPYTVGVLKYIRDCASSIVNSSTSKSYYLLELCPGVLSKKQDHQRVMVDPMLLIG